MLAVASKFQDKPVVFIGVNSGNAPAAVQAYARENRIPWPMIVDADRSIEQSCNLSEVNLENVSQLLIVTPDGRLRYGGLLGDLEAAANRALVGAEWLVEPNEIPASLKPAWLAVEFGNYAAAATTIKRSLNSRMPDVKAAAEKLNQAVTAKLEAEIEAAQSAMSSGEKWQAYKTYASLGERFKGYDVPDDVPQQVEQLAEDADVQTELEAARDLLAAKRLLGSRSTSSQKRGLRTLERLAADASSTEAGKQAQALLDQLKPQ